MAITISQDRAKIEQLLRETKYHMTTSAIAEMVGVDIGKAKMIIEGMNKSTRRKSLDGALDTKRLGNVYSYRILETKKEVLKPAQNNLGKYYDGKELLPFQGRPGAMDAFSIPSLMNGVRVPYIGPRPQCSHRVPDSRSLALG